MSEPIIGIVQNSGIAPDEARWMGLEEFLNQRRGRQLKKDEVLGFIRQHPVKLEEVRLGELDPAQEQIRKKLVAEKTALKSQYDAEVERLQIEHEAAEDKRIEAAKAAGEPTIPEDAHVYNPSTTILTT